MGEQPETESLHAELSIARWYVDAALGAPSAALVKQYVHSAWGVCNGIAAALARATLTGAEREAIEEGLSSVRLRLQSLDVAL